MHDARDPGELGNRLLAEAAVVRAVVTTHKPTLSMVYDQYIAPNMPITDASSACVVYPKTLAQ